MRLAVAREAHRPGVLAGALEDLPALAGPRLPDVDRIGVAAGGRHQAPVGADGRRDHHVVVLGVGGDRLAGGDLPDVGDRRAAGARHQQLAVRREAQRSDQRTLVLDAADIAPAPPVPEPRLAVPAARRQRAVGRRHRQGLHLVLVTGERHDLLAVAHGPHLHGAVVGARIGALLVRREAERVDLVGVAAQLMQHPAIVDIPDDGGQVLQAAARHQELAVARERQAAHHADMALAEQAHQLARREVEQADLAAAARAFLVQPATRRDQPAIGRQCHREVLALVAQADLAADGAHRLAALPVPDADRLVVRGRHQLRAVGRESDALDQGHVRAAVELQDRLVVAVDHLGGHLLRRPRGQCRRDTPLSPGAQDLQAQLGARLLAGEIDVNVGAVVDHRAVDREDDVAVANAGLFGWRSRRRGIGDLGAARGIPAELVGFGLRDVLGFDAELAFVVLGQSRGQNGARKQQEQRRNEQADGTVHKVYPQLNLATLLQVSSANETARHLPAESPQLRLPRIWTYTATSMGRLCQVCDGQSSAGHGNRHASAGHACG